MNNYNNIRNLNQLIKFPNSMQIYNINVVPTSPDQNTVVLQNELFKVIKAKQIFTKNSLCKVKHCIKYSRNIIGQYI